MKRILLSLASPGLLVPVAAAQWSNPVVLANVNSFDSDFDPSPTMDGRTLYFASSRSGNYEIYRAARAAPFGGFGAPAAIPELASPASDSGPCPRSDDLELFFVSNRPGGAGFSDLWRAVRASTSVPFGPPVPVSELNTSTSDASPALTGDGLRIYFASLRPGGAGRFDLWTAARPTLNTPFGAPTPVAELNTPDNEGDCHVSPDGLVIFFSSERAGGQGDNDLWMASRLSPTAPFGVPINVSALNSPVFDGVPAFARFHDEVFFTSNRPGGPGFADIYSARFTGLVGAGIAGPSSTRELRFSDRASPGLLYVAASSLGTSPGIRIDTRTLPLNPDLLLQLTIGGLPPILTGYAGTLGTDGVAAGQVAFAGFPELVGLRFFTAFVVLDANAPSGIRTISNAHEVLVQ